MYKISHIRKLPQWRECWRWSWAGPRRRGWRWTGSWWCGVAWCGGSRWTPGSSRTGTPGRWARTRTWSGSPSPGTPPATRGDSLGKVFTFTLLTSNSLQNMSGRVFTESSLLVSGECDEALLKVYLPCYYFCLVTTYFYIISLAVKIWGMQSIHKDLEFKFKLHWIRKEEWNKDKDPLICGLNIRYLYNINIKSYLLICHRTSSRCWKSSRAVSGYAASPSASPSPCWRGSSSSAPYV